MKGLETLIKLQKTLVDEQRIHVAKLQAHADELDAQMAELQIAMAREQVTAEQDPESQMTYGNFIKSAIELGRILDKEKIVAAAAVEVARQKLSELFEEQKRYEIAREQRLEQQRQLEKQRENKFFDDVGSTGFIRNKEDQG